MPHIFKLIYCVYSLSLGNAFKRKKSFTRGELLRHFFFSFHKCNRPLLKWEFIWFLMYVSLIIACTRCHKTNKASFYCQKYTKIKYKEQLWASYVWWLTLYSLYMFLFMPAQRWKFIHKKYLTLNFFPLILLLDFRVVCFAMKIGKKYFFKKV